MLRKVLWVLVASLLLLGLGFVGLAKIFGDVGDFGGGGPRRAGFIDESVGSLKAPLSMTGDVLLRSRGGAHGVQAQPLTGPSRIPVKLFDGRYISSVAPDGRHVVASTDVDRWRVIRLSDLRAVAEVEGGEPVFLDSDRVLTVFDGRRCTRADARLMDLRSRTTRRITLSGDRARLRPVAVTGDTVVALRLGVGDSGCGTAGAAHVDLETGRVTTFAKEGDVVTWVAGYTWLSTATGTKVIDREGRSVGSGPKLLAANVGNRVVYADSPYQVSGGGLAADEPTSLRLGDPAGPVASDPSGQALLKPDHIAPTADLRAVLVTHRGMGLPKGGRARLLSICPLPQLVCREVGDVTGDFSPNAITVPASLLPA